jgi:hypothetical protein
MKYIRLWHDPKEETSEAFEARKAEAIAATGEPEEVTIVIREIVHRVAPTVDYCGNA